MPARSSTAEQPLPMLAAKVRVPLVTALVRERLHMLLEGVWNRRLGLVVAPAGSGKTTLLAHFAQAADIPVAWYRLEESDREPEVLLSYLEKTLTEGAKGLKPGWSTLEHAVAALESWAGRAMLVLDDLHLLEASESEETLERFIDYAPAGLRILAASRGQPDFNLPRLRVSGALLEVDVTDLRFRPWETERLFNDFYRQPLHPEELAILTRRTEGWAAGLQLFHLATLGSSPDERGRAITALGARSKSVHNYLIRNVVAGLSLELREFLQATCVLGRLTGPICDEFLGRMNSGRLLEELEERQIFTIALDDKGTYRYHEVLRSFLETTLAGGLDDAAMAGRYERAGMLLEQAGFLPEALRAYARAGAWSAADRFLDDRGDQLVARPGTWIHALPATLADGDPWLLLARARLHFSAGRLRQAVEAYERAEAAFGPATANETCRVERRAASRWLEWWPQPVLDWASLLRAAVRHDPSGACQAARGISGPTGRLTEGVAALLAGDRRDAFSLLDEVAAAPDSSPEMAVAARLATVLATFGDGRDGRLADIEQLILVTDRLGVPWLNRMAHAALALSERGGGRVEAASVRRMCDQEGDEWGAALAAWLEGIGLLWHDSAAVEVLEEVVARLAKLGAGTLEAWCRSFLALARAQAGEPRAHESAVQAELFARQTKVRGAQGLAVRVLAATSEGERQAEFARLAVAIAAEGGNDWDVLVERALGSGAGPATGSAAGNGAIASDPDSQPSAPWLTVRCLGGFSLSIGERLVDLNPLKPRARAVLRLLALYGDQGMHREQLVDALWPEIDPLAATRNLHVAISAVRRCLEPEADRGRHQLLVREGDSYRLQLGDDADFDLREFRRALTEARLCRNTGDHSGAVQALRRALDAYRGELLPEDGPAEWVVKERERLRIEAATAAANLAELELSRGRPEAAVAAARHGLEIDQYHDALWRLLQDAHHAAGDPLAARQAARGYQAALVDLGVAPTAVP
jgi:DNA-binding SARP family transcriptional activator